MGKLIYSMITSLDGYTKAAEGDLGDGGADDEEVHTFIGDTFRPVRTFLYGRRMYETMVFWETAHTLPDAPPFVVQFARDWQTADKIVYSTTLDSVSSERTGSSAHSTRTRCAPSRPNPITTCPSTVRPSPPRQSRRAWWTSTTCSSPRPWSVAAPGSSRTGCGWSSTWSSSEPSPTV
mgnify:CR=1 FL=1